MEKSKLVVGLMSGTSLDGVDAVLLNVTGDGVKTKFDQLVFIERPFPRGLRKLLLRNSAPETSRVDDIARLNFFLAELYAEAVKRVARRGRVKLSQIALIGSHGQTIQHLPKTHKMLGTTIRSTLQIGDPSVVATLTGVPTVGDFRVADMAVGGQGAPLVPYFDWLVFRSNSKNRILINLGGIANMTVLPRNCLPERVYAFDTGPGNMIVDALMHEFYGKRYDRNGKTAARGMVSLELLERMAKHPYLKARPPKSTGREEFGREYVDEFLRHAKRYDRQDIVATAAQFTAYAVYDAYRRFVEKRVQVDEVIVSGGGAKNTYVVDELGRYFGFGKVKRISEFGISTDAKEAICFAILANETMAGRPTNLPRVTGAKKRVVLGKICRP
jgi:anhydro-N-acetylmuramic acid kinase